MKHIAAVLSIAFVASLGMAASASAQPPVEGEVLVVLAKESGGTVDPALRNIAALRRPPFNGFSSMSILDRPRVSLRTGRPTTVNLPNGRRLRITLQQIMPNGRFRVLVSINRPQQNDYLPLLSVVASPGDPFFVAGQSHEGGTLVIGVRVGVPPAAPNAATEPEPEPADPPPAPRNRNRR